MSKLLIIGDEYPGITSVGWNSLGGLDVTAYDTVLVNLDTFTEINPLHHAKLVMGLTLVLKKQGNVFYFLPRREARFEKGGIMLIDAKVEKKEGKKPICYDDDEFVAVVEGAYLKQEIVLSEYTPLEIDFQMQIATLLVWSRDHEHMGVKMGGMYILPQPDPRFHIGVLRKLIDLIDPERADEEAVTWASKFVVDEMRVSGLLDEIKKIGSDMENLKKEHAGLKARLKNVAKWEALLTEDSRGLSIALKEAFTFLGIKDIEQHQGGADLKFSYDGVNFIATCSGSKGAAGSDGIRGVLELMASEPHDTQALFIANPFNDRSPVERPSEASELFTGEALELAKSREVRLLTSRGVFSLLAEKTRTSYSKGGKELSELLRGK